MLIEKKLLNIARTLQIQPNIALKYWEEYILIATYILNRLLKFQKIKPYMRIYIKKKQIILKILNPKP